MWRILFCFLIAPTICYGESGSKSFFKQEAIDIGSTANGRTETVVFEFENRVGHTVVINDVKKSCGCEKVSFPKHPIKLYQKGAVKVEIHIKQLKGHLKKSLLLYADGLPPTILKITGEVK